MKIYVGNIDKYLTERELEDEFTKYGRIRSVWVARKPSGFGKELFAFVEMDDSRDAEDAVKGLDGKRGWKVELSKHNRDGGGYRGGGRDRDRDFGGGRPSRRDSRCYACGEFGHFARDCRSNSYRGSKYDRYATKYSRGRSYSRSRSRTPPRRRRSDRSPTPKRRYRSLSRSRSPISRSRSPSYRRSRRSLSRSISARS